MSNKKMCFQIIIAQGRETVDLVDEGTLSHKDLLTSKKEGLVYDSYEFNTMEEVSAFSAGIEAVDGWEHYSYEVY